MDTTDWAEKLQAEAMAKIATAGSGRRQKIHRLRWKTDVVDKKEVAVWKLQDGVTKPDFRHWLDIIDSNLDAAHHFQYPEIVLDKLRRFDKEVTAANWREIIEQANEELRKTKKNKGAADGLLDHGEGFDAWAIDLAPE